MRDWLSEKSVEAADLILPYAALLPGADVYAIENSLSGVLRIGFLLASVFGGKASVCACQ